ncbi:MAG: translation initiation factor IF-6 [DPANN group archaeon]|nr:translation initiation factor IF-6 [DPANN group archaeon]
MQALTETSEKHILITELEGNSNVGLFGIATDKFCLVGRTVRESIIKEIEKILRVPVFQVGLYGTELVGLFCAANSNSVLLPDIVSEHELKTLKKDLEKINVSVNIIKTEHTALGNTILLNDKSGIVSEVYGKKAFDEIKKAFPNVEFVQMDLSGLPTPRTVGIVTACGGIFSPNLSDSEIKKIERVFGFEIGLGTVNLGNPFVSTGIIANSNGFVIGRASSGYEISRVDESFGFIKGI